MRWLLSVALALTFAVTLASASLRLSQAGIGCEPWPQCHAAIDAGRSAGRSPAMPDWHEGVRLTHRVSASAAGLLYLFIVLFGWSRWGAGARVAGALLLADSVFLALLGRVTPSEHAGVVLGNLVGGFALLGALAWLIGGAGRVAEAAPGSHDFDAVAGSSAARRGTAWLAAITIAVASGALLAREAGWAVAAPQPLVEVSAAGWAHAALALLALAIGGVALRRGTAVAGRIALLLLGVALVTGVALWIVGGRWLALAVGHNAIAAIVVACAAAAVAGHRRSGARPIDLTQAAAAAGSAH